MTADGWAMWDVVLKLGGQMRLMPGSDRAVMVGWDMSAALALADALGVPGHIAAEVLPAVEAAAAQAWNDPDAAIAAVTEGGAS